MRRVESFPPIAGPHAHTLILGTMPGAASLRARAYYAHPRNAFWTILGRLLDFDPQLDYAARTRHVVAAGIAVWDVLRSCERDGSLDTKILRTSVVVNDFGWFFTGHPHIERVFFNGATAHALYRRHVLPAIDDVSNRQYARLPSTSPANASIALPAKLHAWGVVLNGAGRCALAPA
jgi:hypoxanthine-DNA glycosylase